MCAAVGPVLLMVDVHEFRIRTARYRALALMFFVALIINLVGDVLVARHLGVAGIAVVSSAVYVALDLAMTVTALRYAARAGSGSILSKRARRAALRRVLQIPGRAQILEITAASLIAVALAVAISHVS